jgi:hypothetical protein
MTKVAKRRPADLTQYDPQKSLLKIDVLGGLEARFRKAKDAVGLIKAIEEKMTEQRNFVLWWDANRLEGRPNKASLACDALLLRKDLGTDKDTIHRWRKLKDEKKGGFNAWMR